MGNGYVDNPTRQLLANRGIHQHDCERAAEWRKRQRR